MMIRVTFFLASAAVTALLCGTAIAQDNPVVRFLDRAVDDFQSSIDTARSNGWRNEVRGSRNDDDDDDDDDNGFGGRGNDDDDDNGGGFGGRGNDDNDDDD